VILLWFNIHGIKTVYTPGKEICRKSGYPESVISNAAKNSKQILVYG
jgi:hypothetical protein